MTDNTKKIICPKCGELISIDDVLSRQIETKYKQEFAEKETQLRATLEVESKKVMAEQSVEYKKQIKAEIEKETVLEKKHLEEQLAEKDGKLKEARQNEAACHNPRPASRLRHSNPN